MCPVVPPASTPRAPAAAVVKAVAADVVAAAAVVVALVDAAAVVVAAAACPQMPTDRPQASACASYTAESGALPAARSWPITRWYLPGRSPANPPGSGWPVQESIDDSSRRCSRLDALSVCRTAFHVC